MKKVIVTGFEPFGSYKFNPTKELAEWNDMRTVTGKERIIGIVLPCTYRGAFEKLSKIIDEEKPDAIISTGLSSTVGGIRIETRFRNRMLSKYADANGYKPKGIRINRKRGAYNELTPFCDHTFFRKTLDGKGIPVEVSQDANTFICNSLGYLTTQKILSEHLPIRNMFIHIPWTDEYKDRVNLEPGKIFLPADVTYTAIDILVEHI